MRTQIEKGNAFRALHQRARAFIIPNPWDIGTARLLAHLGFEALATTSAGFAFSLGQRDNTVGRDKMIAALQRLSLTYGQNTLPKQVAAFGISGGVGHGLRKLMMSHPPLEQRIDALRNWQPDAKDVRQGVVA